MKIKIIKNVGYILEKTIYYIFYPISIIVIDIYKRENKNKFFEQITQLESYKIFKERENCSYFNKDDNQE